MVNLLKVKTIRNFINVVKIGIVLFKYGIKEQMDT